MAHVTVYRANVKGVLFIEALGVWLNLFLLEFYDPVLRN